MVRWAVATPPTARLLPCHIQAGSSELPVTPAWVGVLRAVPRHAPPQLVLMQLSWWLQARGYLFLLHWSRSHAERAGEVS